MILILLALQASAEWVEITQQHYRQPTTLNNPFEDIAHFNYNNYTTEKNNWNSKLLQKGNNQGSEFKNDHKPETNKFQDNDILILKEDRNNFDYNLNYKPNKAGIEKAVTQKGFIERVPNTGVVKRVQLNNTPVKSPVINNKKENTMISTVKHHKETTHHDLVIEDITEDNISAYPKKNNVINRRLYVTNLNGPTTNVPEKDHKDHSFKEEVTTTNRVKYTNNTTVSNIFSPKPTFYTATEDFSELESEENKRFYRITDSSLTDDTTEKIKPHNDLNLYNDKKFVTKNNVDHPHRLADANDNDKLKYTVVTGQPNKDKITEFKMSDKGNTGVDSNLDIKADNKKLISDENPTVTQSVLQSSKEQAQKKMETKSNVNALENIAKFMKIVTNTITKNSRKSFGGKVQYLHELKNTILANIESRIEAAWPDDTGRRHSREAESSPRGHVVHLPSSESALMTISFLTFAVFLIKLVLQVIQTYKHKTMMVAPLVVTGRAAFHQGQH